MVVLASCYVCGSSLDECECGDQREVWSTIGAVCPECGTEFLDDEGQFSVAGEHDCDDCGARFFCEPDFEITYMTSRRASVGPTEDPKGGA